MFRIYESIPPPFVARESKKRNVSTHGCYHKSAYLLFPRLYETLKSGTHVTDVLTRGQQGAH